MREYIFSAFPEFTCHITKIAQLTRLAVFFEDMHLKIKLKE